MQKITIAVLLSLSLFQQASALSIALDYSHDTSGFFSNLTAKTSLEKAAQDLSNAITTTLAPITTDTYTGTNGATSAVINWNVTYTNPSTGEEVTLETFSAAADTYTIFVGARPLADFTLGQGGVGGAGFNLTGGGQSSQWAGALAAAESASNAGMGRGTPVTFGTLDGSSSFGPVTADYSLRYGSIVGNLWFDNDTNNDGDIDSAAMIGEYWNLDSALDSFAGKNDLYSVALHEMIHALGFGNSESWDATHTGTTWDGPNAAILNGGTGTGLLDADQAHLASGYLSTRIDNGVAQEAVMDPSVLVGTRKYLTAVDLAVLQDMGYQVVPEANTLSVLLVGLGSLYWMKRRRDSKCR